MMVRAFLTAPHSRMNSSIWARTDTTGLTALVHSARRFSQRTPGVAVATACYRVGMTAMANTPTTPSAHIYSELSIDVTIAVGPRGGRRKSLALTDANSYDVLKPIPFAALIVIARMRPGSNFNRLTGGRFAIPNNTRFTEAQLRAPRVKAWLAAQPATVATAKRMVSARQSSRAFLKSLWLAGLRQLVATGLVSQSAFRAGSTRDASPRGKGPADGGWGLVRSSGASATAELANAAGLAGGNAVMAARRNEALWRHVAPVLDRAVATEALSTMEYIAKQEARTAFAHLKSSGIVIDI